MVSIYTTSKQNHDTNLSDGIAFLTEAHGVNKTNAAAIAKKLHGAKLCHSDHLSAARHVSEDVYWMEAFTVVLLSVIIKTNCLCERICKVKVFLHLQCFMSDDRNGPKISGILAQILEIDNDFSFSVNMKP